MAVWGIGVKPARPLAGSITGYGLPDMHLIMPCKLALRSIIARHGKPLRTAYALKIQYCVIRWVYIATCKSKHQVYLQSTPQLTRLTARVVVVR